MLLDSAAILIGFILLIWSADRFICGASATATNLSISPLIIGLTIVGFGTSAPEMLVATFASAGGNPGLAIGNALGSNIANIALILGVAALVRPLAVHSGILRKELPVLLAVTLLAIMLMLDNVLDVSDGIILMASLVLIMWWLMREAVLSKADDPMQTEYSQEIQVMPIRRAVIWLIVGLVVLIASSRLLVWGSVNIATTLGVSDLVIGLTIIAVGTSLPELAASIAGALKNEHDIVIGNVVGSNLFNTLAVLSIPGLLAPGEIAAGVMSRDIPVVFILTVACFIMAYGFRKPGTINRLEGSVLVSLFVVYMFWIYLNETGML